MPGQNINKHVINFTREDIIQYYKNIYIKLILDKEHPDIIARAEQLATEFYEQEHVET